MFYLKIILFVNIWLMSGLLYYIGDSYVKKNNNLIFSVRNVRRTVILTSKPVVNVKTLKFFPIKL